MGRGNASEASYRHRLRGLLQATSGVEGLSRKGMLEPGLVSLLHRLWPLRTSELLHWPALPTPPCSDPRTSFLPCHSRARQGTLPSTSWASSRSKQAGVHAAPAPAPALPVGAGESSLQSTLPAPFERMSPMCVSTNFIQVCPKLRHQPQCPHQTKSGHALRLANINKDRWRPLEPVGRGRVTHLWDQERLSSGEAEEDHPWGEEN